MEREQAVVVDADRAACAARRGALTGWSPSPRAAARSGRPGPGAEEADVVAARRFQDLPVPVRGTACRARSVAGRAYGRLDFGRIGLRRRPARECGGARRNDPGRRPARRARHPGEQRRAGRTGRSRRRRTARRPAAACPSAVKSTPNQLITQISAWNRPRPSWGDAGSAGSVRTTRSKKMPTGGITCSRDTGWPAAAARPCRTSSAVAGASTRRCGRRSAPGTARGASPRRSPRTPSGSPRR